MKQVIHLNVAKAKISDPRLLLEDDDGILYAIEFMDLEANGWTFHRKNDSKPSERKQ